MYASGHVSMSVRSTQHGVRGLPSGLGRLLVDRSAPPSQLKLMSQRSRPNSQLKAFKK